METRTTACTAMGTAAAAAGTAMVVDTEAGT